MLKKILFSFLFYFFVTSIFAGEIYGISKVVDGDTIKIKGKVIRLSGIDAPEKKQICKKPYINISFIIVNKNYSCGKISTTELKKYLNKNKIKCIFDSKDRYNRLIADCYKNKKNINSWLVRNGHAIAYRRYSKKYIVDENYAKKNKLGIWQGSFENPENWRKNK